ncbi:PQQ-binding-like beta-propeller repeat protein [candidate division KSB1 bacterium]|nr:PQQ-binding-like beta-propeller repeat protein [candidate division KSB1 bacterium]
MKISYTWRIALSLALALGLTAQAALAFPKSDKGEKNDWPNWRGRNYDGVALTKNVFNFSKGHGLKAAWKKKLGSAYSSISIADGRAFTMFSDSTFDYLIAFEAKSGAELWRHKIDSTYIGHDGSHNGPNSTPLIDGDIVYGLGRKGQLFALEVKSGKKLWETHLVKDHHGLEPFHGFTTSPIVQDEILVLETGGTKTNAISGFDKNSGKLLWATGTDTVNYQSPIFVSIAGQPQLLFAGDKYVYGLDHKSGKKFWEFNHKNQNQSLTPVVAGPNRIMLMANNESMLVEVSKEGDNLQTRELWKSRELKQTLTPTVYHEGYLYGYSGFFLTCVNATTGERAWRSRPPGDGFVILVDGHLVIMTKTGELHIAAASPAGYEEKANIKLFDGLTWTPPSFAEGRIYARSLQEIASVEIAPATQLLAVTRTVPKLHAPNSAFAQSLRKIENAQDKNGAIDAFMKTQTSFPIIEDNKLAHFVYRGQVEDLAIMGDMFDLGQQSVMFRVPGTDLYYYTIEVEPDARLNYRFVKNFEQRITDPLNPVSAGGFLGRFSELAMPKFKRPTHLDEPTGARGTIDSLQFESKVFAGSRALQIYLPSGYANSSKRYPVVYVNYGQQALRMGKMANTLDNLIGKTIEPVIAVFIHAPNSFTEYARAQRDKYAEMVAQELVPFIDAKYRTLTRPEARAFMGADEGGYAAFYATFKYPGTFAHVGGQSTHLFPTESEPLKNMIKASKKLDLNIYLDWGTYDHRTTGSFDWAEFNSAFAKMLEEQGYKINGGQVHDGFDWASWRTRTDRVLETFFSLAKKVN